MNIRIDEKITKTPIVGSEKGRVEWIDIAKALAIYLVVLGHTLAGWGYDYIYSFHMPFFFILSGMTFKIRPTDSYRTFLLRKVRTLLVPYFCFGIVAILVFLLTGRLAAKTLEKDIDFGFVQMCANLCYGNGANNALKFYTALWFLPALFAIENIYYFLQKIVGPHCRLNRFCLFLSILFFAFNALYFFNDYGDANYPILPFGLDAAVLKQFPYFVFGLLLATFLCVAPSKDKARRSLLVHKFSDERTYIIAAILLIGAGLCCFVANGRLESVSNLVRYALKILTALTSSAGCLFLCRFIKTSKPLSLIGKKTLAILVLHKYPILFFQVLCPPTVKALKANDLPVVFIVSIIALVSSLAVGLIIERYFPFALGKKKTARVVLEPETLRRSS